MTSDKVRYFQNAHTGKVQSVENPVLAAEVVRDPAYTEVQVVPLDAIVIRRDELPKVCQGERGLTVEGIGGYFRASAEYTNGITARDYALALLATQEHLREHPPVDEEQVKALADVLDEIDDPSDKELQADWRVVARRLVERGVRVEAKPNEEG